MEESCYEYLIKHLKEGWEVVEYEHPLVVIKKENIKKEIDLRNDILYLIPTSNGFKIELSPYPSNYRNVECVDDPVGSPDGDSTYVYTTSTTPKIDYYAHEIINKSEVIKYVDIFFVCRTINQGYCNPHIYNIFTSQDAYGASINLTTTYTTYYYRWTNNPWTGSKWTWKDINDIQFGIELWCPAVARTDARCTQIYLAVCYSPAKPTLHLDKGPHPRSRMSFYPKLTL